MKVVFFVSYIIYLYLPDSILWAGVILIRIVGIFYVSTIFMLFVFVFNLFACQRQTTKGFLYSFVRGTLFP